MVKSEEMGLPYLKKECWIAVNSNTDTPEESTRRTELSNSHSFAQCRLKTIDDTFVVLNRIASLKQLALFTFC